MYTVTDNDTNTDIHADFHARILMRKFPFSLPDTFFVDFLLTSSSAVVAVVTSSICELGMLVATVNH